MKDKFIKDNFLVIKKAIDPKIANFIYKYFILKRQVARTFFDVNYISGYTNDWGVWNDFQAPETYSHYADIVMETLLTEVKPIIEKKTGLKLIPTYSYARLYKTGDELKRHKDRFSCEISTTLNLGGDKWPIYIEGQKNVGTPEEGYLNITKNKGTKVTLNPGDMLIYKGNICEHWREKFEGINCAQVFLHYNDAKTPGSYDNQFDKRKHLGLPQWFKGKKI